MKNGTAPTRCLRDRGFDAEFIKHEYARCVQVPLAYLQISGGSRAIITCTIPDAVIFHSGNTKDKYGLQDLRKCTLRMR